MSIISGIYPGDGFIPTQAQFDTKRAHNDHFRRQCCGDQVSHSRGSAGLSDVAPAELLHLVQTIEAFKEAPNDPGEHQFGTLAYRDQSIFWFIGYYDPELRYASEDPANPMITRRQLTIMLLEERSEGF